LRYQTNPKVYTHITQNITQQFSSQNLQHIPQQFPSQYLNQIPQQIPQQFSSQNFTFSPPLQNFPQVQKTIGQVRVGSRLKQGKNWIDPSYPGFTNILCLTKSSPYGHLGPYVLKDEKGRLMENIWQFSKIWPNYPGARERYSQYNPQIIWEHPAETHLDFNTGMVTPEYFSWRQKGMFNPYPVRYPAGFRHKRDAYCSFAEDENGNINSQGLNYIEARKKIYLPVFCRLVRQDSDFHRLQQRLFNGENLLIIEVDGPKQESMQYYKDTYNVTDDFIKQDTIIVNDYNMNIMLNDPKHSFGHGYCLGLALLNAEQKFCT